MFRITADIQYLDGPLKGIRIPKGFNCTYPNDQVSRVLGFLARGHFWNRLMAGGSQGVKVYQDTITATWEHDQPSYGYVPNQIE